MSGATEKDARAQLGEWLAAKQLRWWEWNEDGDEDGEADAAEKYAVELYEDGFNQLEGAGFGGYGPTLAAAILDALGKLHEDDR